METLAPFEDSRPLLGQPEALRERMQRDGYLFFRGLLPADALEEVYDAIMTLCRQKGWVDDEGCPVGEPRLEGTPEWFEVYDPLQCLEVFHALAHRDELVGVMEALTQEAVLVHPLKIARIVFPKAEFFSTPPHQDWVHIQGTTETYTAWIPLQDCPQELGGLAVLEGSHTLGLLPVRPATGPGGLGVNTEPLPGRWRTIDYQQGDVLVFHSYTVHKALPNLTADRLRVSVDFRYQGVSQPVAETPSLLPHYNRLTWDEIYRHWTRTDLQYYWRKLPLKVAPRESIPWEREYQPTEVNP